MVKRESPLFRQRRSRTIGLQRNQQLQCRCYSYEHIKVEDRPNGIKLVTFNRPERRNSLSMQMANEIKAFAKEAWAMKPIDLRCVVLTGQGTAFSSGRDLKESATHTTKEMKRAYLDACMTSVVAVHEMPVPVIAAINGAAFGWGMEVALGADITIVKPDALLCLPETNLGIFPGAGGIHALSKRVGLHIAKYWIYTAKQFTGAEAKEVGIVNEVNGDPVERALAIACRIGCNGPLGVRGAKALFAELEDGHERPLAGNMSYSHTIMSQEESMRRRLPLNDTADFAEALAAFREKRKALFKGE